MKFNTRALSFAFLSLFVLGLGDNVRGPLFPEILKHFSISNSEGSLFFVVASVLGTVSGFLAQPVLLKIGSLRTLQAGLLSFALGLSLFAWSDQFSGFLWGSFFFGWGLGFMGVIQNFYVIAGSPTEKVQQAQSALHSMYGLASFAAPALVGVFADAGMSWRTGFWICSGAALLVFLITFFVRGQSLPESSSAQESAEAHRANGTTPASGFELSFWGSILASYVLFEIMVGTRLALFMREVHGKSLEESSYWTTAFFALLLSGRLLFVFWRPPLKIKSQLFLCLGFSIVFMMLGLLVHPLGFVMSGLSMAPFYPLVMTAAGRIHSQEVSRVSAYSITLTGVFVVVMHLTVGLLSDSLGIQKALWIGPFAGALSLIFLSTYPRLFKRSFEF